MANLSNINNILRTGSLGVGINRDPLGAFEISSATKPGIKMFNTAVSGKTYEAYSDANGNYIIYDQDADDNRFVINTSGNATFAGNVGIGAAASDGNLHVRKTGVNTGITNVLMNANFADGSNGTGLSIGYRTDETTAVIAARTATGNIAFYSYDAGWSESMRIKNNGNVGIGATLPTTKVEINQTNNDIYQLTLHNTHLSTTAKTRIGNWVDLLKISSNYMQSGGTKTQDNTSKASWVQTMGDDLFDISRSPAGSTTLSSLMIINSLGNVGIGTDSPDAKLDILGQTLNLGGNNGSWNARTNSTVKTGFITSPHYTNAEEDIMGMIMIGLSNANEINIGGGTSTYNAATDIKFFTASNFTTVTGTERMRINSQGQTWLGGSFTGSDIANGNGTYLNNLNAGGFSVLHRNAADVYLHFNTYYNSSNNYTAKYGGSQGFRIDNGSTGGLGFYKAPVVTTAGDTQTFSHVMQVGYSASNNVGIGTTSPEQKLHVEGASITVNRGNDDSSIAFQNSTSNATWRIGRDYSNSEALTFAYSATDYPSLTGNGLIYINTSGNVGIGTDSPRAVGSGYKGLEVSSSSSGSSLWLSGFSDSTKGYLAMDTGGLNLTAISNHSLTFGTNNSPKMTILSGGNVGIGTTSPYAKLEAQGPNIVSASPVVIKKAKLLNLSLATSAYYGGFAEFWIGRYANVSNHAKSILTISLNDGLYGSNTNADTDVMTLRGDGNVGIGTTSPSTSFQVKNNFFEHALGKTHTGIGDLFSIQFGTSGQNNKGSIIVTIFGSRFSPGQNDYAGGAVYYLTRSNVGTITTVTASTTGTWQPVIDTNNTTKIWTFTSASPLGGSAGNFTSYSVTIQGIGHNGSTVINPTVTIL